MSFWKKRNTLVTGATGFVGANLSAKLVQQEANVVCLQRDAVPANSLDLLEVRPNITVVDGMVEDLALMERILNEYEVESVFHLAAQPLVGIASRSPYATFESNIRGTYSLLEACRRNPGVKRVVVASSDKAYGTHEHLPYSEDSPLLGLFPYDASKVCTDVLARSFAHSYALPVVVTRFANIYGGGDMNLSRMIPGTIVSVLRNEAPIIRSDGTPLRDFIYIDDVTGAYLLLAEKIDAVRGEGFNFGGGQPVQVLDLVRRIIRLTGNEGLLSPRVMLKSKIESEIDAQYLSSEKAATRLQWQPAVELDDGLRRTIDWYRKNLSKIP